MRIKRGMSTRAADVDAVGCALDWGDACTPCWPGATDQCNAGSTCVVTNQSEGFCAEPCDDQGGCKAGYRCEAVADNAGSKQLCVPEDLSCYY